MHKNNKHINGYDFKALVKDTPSLSNFIIKNKYNNLDTIDFKIPEAVKLLNTALLKTHYNINCWDIPTGYLCPAIPGRVDYIHHLNDLPLPTKIKQLNSSCRLNVLDVGTGAGGIFALLGQSVFDWSFVASDIDAASIQSATKIINANPTLNEKITCRLQTNHKFVFNGIIQENEFYHYSLCNPPFHSSLEEATKGTTRKWKNLAKNSTNKLSDKKNHKLNFGGQKAELWCEGGEVTFVRNMIKESAKYQTQVFWFTCLISKKENVSKLKHSLKKSKAKQIKVVSMEQGNKTSRFIAWSFFN